MEQVPVKLKVLYADDGRIVSLSWLREPGEGNGPNVPVLRSGAEPGKHQRYAIVEVDAALRERQLGEIHQRFMVVDRGDGVRLIERQG
jgi:hypothetical protein